MKRRGVERRDEILLATVHIAERLLLSSDWRAEMPDVLCRLGTAAEASRVYVFENHTAENGEVLTSQQFEWVSEGVTPQIDNPDLQNVPLITTGFQRWVERLQEGKMIAGRVADFPPAEQDFLAAQDILAILVVPIFVNHIWWGFIGFDECLSERQWTKDETEALRMAASTLGAAIERQQREHEQQAVARLNAAMREAATSSALYSVVLDELLKILEGDGAALMLYDPFEDEQVVVLARGVWENWTGMRLNIRTDKHFSISPQDSGICDQRPAGLRLMNGCSSVACAPLIAGEQTIGAIWLGRRKPVFVTDQHLLTALANSIANAIHRSQMSERIRQQIKWLEGLHQIQIAVSSVLDMQTMLNVLLAQVVAALDVDSATIFLFDPFLNELVLKAVVGQSPQHIDRFRLRLGQSMAGRAAKLRQIIPVPDLLQAREQFTISAPVFLEGFVSYYGVPLIAKGQLKGVLEIFLKRPIRAEPHWLAFLETLAQQTAIAVDNVQMFENLQRANLNLSLAYEKTIEGLARAMELRDRETKDHALRVAEMAIELARMMGVPNQELVHIRRGALLHDIGKLGVPDQILLKPGPLSEEEMEMMIRHPLYAFQMLEPIEHLRKALDIPYCHHEKWDGSGYPRGLKGEQIPLAARIFAVIDVWDALNSERPYRPAWKREDVVAYIRSQAGKHFDPAVVEAFLHIIGED